MPDSPRVGVTMGSESDLPVMEESAQVLHQLDIPFEMRVLSAHRTPAVMHDYAREAESRGLDVIIAGAGKAAHLPGMIAASTVLPVIGVPIPTTDLGGKDSLLSIVQMPGGVPVATVAIGGGKNAGLLAAQMLSVGDEKLRTKLHQMRDQLKEKVRQMDDNVQKAAESIRRSA